MTARSRSIDAHVVEFCTAPHDISALRTMVGICVLGVLLRLLDNPQYVQAVRHELDITSGTTAADEGDNTCEPGCLSCTFFTLTKHPP